MRICIIVGHRGTGKTTLLERIKVYCLQENKNVVTVDLDHEIEKREARTISAIFAEQGEPFFRQLEEKYFHSLIEELEGQEAYIAVGGGFNTALIPEPVPVIFLQRATQKFGRIFLDRPPLDPGIDPLAEYFQRAEIRQELFFKAAWAEYLMPEGLEDPSAIEKQILFGSTTGVGGIITLLPALFQSQERWQFFIARRLGWNLDFFEIRDDLLSDDQIKIVLRDIPRAKLLWARRTQNEPRFFDPRLVAMVDYDRSLIKKATADPGQIISVHELNPGETFATLFQTLEAFEKRGCHLKIAIEIANFAELKLVHEWCMQNSRSRSFLPRSSQGRWQWYRLWRGSSQKINFFREGLGSAIDQPTLYQWLQQKGHQKEFAALLGSPVDHSFTPINQGPFFHRFDLGIFAIEVEEREYEEALAFLTSIGLVAAAVTSPLKLAAFRNVSSSTEKARNYGSVNTLIRGRDGHWQGHNTDEEGFIALLEAAKTKLGESLQDQTIAVWGGGGTLPLIKAQLPGACYFSVQTGQQRNAVSDLQRSMEWRPRVVIWAAGRFSGEGIKTPPADWSPELVVDLNYRDDSGGRELAQQCGCQYLSGLTMFKVQAEHQRLFWSPFLAERCLER